MAQFDKLDWTWKPDALETIEHRFSRAKQIPLVTPAMVAELASMDPRSLEAGLMGSNPEGLYQPAK